MDLPHSLKSWLVALVLLLSPLAPAGEEIAASPSAPPAKLGETNPCQRADELWLISTRHLCFPVWSDPSTYDFDVRRYDASVGWRDSSLAEFTAAANGENRSTVVYVHANRTNWSEALQQGHFVYSSLTSCAGDAPPMRFVIWSWPSDRLHGAIRDAQVKADRADAEGSFFGWFLSQLEPGTSVGVIGFSYGSRIISGGLQLLSGGSLNGHTLPALQQGDPLRIHAVYMAAAMDVNWLYPWGYHGQSLSQVERLLIMYNQCDPALRRFQLVDRRNRPTALGYSGIYEGSVGDAAYRVEQLDVSGIVGRSHDEMRYWCSSYILGEICRVIFGDLPAHDQILSESSAANSERPDTEQVTATSDVEQPTPPVVEEAVAQETVVPSTDVDVESSADTTEQASTSSAGHRFLRSGRLLGRRR